VLAKLARLVLERSAALQNQVTAMREAVKGVYACSAYRGGHFETPELRELERAVRSLIIHCDGLADSMREDVQMESGETEMVPVVSGWIVEFPGDEDKEEEFAGPFDTEDEAKQWVENHIFDADDRLWSVLPITTNPDDLAR